MTREELKEHCKKQIEMFEMWAKWLEQKLNEMTAEEYRQRMIQAFRNADCDELIAICVLPTEKEFEHLEWLLKNHYKKEPCEDAISKQAAQAEIKAICNKYKLSYEDGEGKDVTECSAYALGHAFDALPSVTLHQNTGRWIKEISLHGWDGNSYQCSVCGRSIHLDTEIETLDDYPYCHCGSKMKEVQE